MLGKETAWRAFIGAVLVASTMVAQDQKPAEIAQTLTGTVVDEAGKPIAGAAIGLLKRTELADVKALLKSPQFTSDKGGGFSIPRPKGKSVGMNVLVAAKGRQACSTLANYAESPAKVDLGEFVLPRGASLVGRIRDPEGKPLAGVEVRVTSAVKAPSYGRTISRKVLSGGVSNTRGIFQVPCVPRTGLRLAVSKKGYHPIVRIVSHESPLAFTLEPAPIVTGKFVDADGKPIADASVSINLEGDPTRTREYVRTAADGSYTLTVPSAPQRYRITTYTTTPYRQFESPLLRGAQTNPSIKESSGNGDAASQLTLKVIDKATKKSVPKFAAAVTSMRIDNPQTAMFHAESQYKDYEGEPQIPLRYQGTTGVVVLAPGRAAQVTEVPEDLDEPLVIELEKGAVLHGRVIDVNNKPVAGVAVRAFPDGRSSGSGGKVSKYWPRTDKDGKYRIDFLQPGEHQVQVYPSNRAASPPEKVKVALDKETKLNLTIDAEQKLTLHVTGDLPPGPAPVIANTGFNRGGGGFQHSVPAPRPVTLRRGQSDYDFGFVQGRRVSLNLFLPSRTRTGSGTTIPLDTLEIVDGKVEVKLPELACTVLRGRIEVNTQLPTARIAVMATPINEERQAFQFRALRQQRVVAGVFADGTFMIDLPNTEHVLQLVDVETGIVFHTEANNHKPDVPDLVIRPDLHWLDMQLKPAEEGGTIVVGHFQAELDRPRGGQQAAFLQSYPGRGRGTDSQSINLQSHPMQLRWLVPEGELKIEVRQAPDILRTGRRSYRFSSVAQDSVGITKPEHTIKLQLPAPPTDEELEEPQK